METVSIKISPVDLATIKAIAKRERRTLTSQLSIIIETYVKKNKN